MVLLGRALMNRIFKQFPVGVRDPGVDKLARYKATPSGRKGINAARDFHRYVHRSGKAFPVKISSAKIPIRKKVRTTCGKRRAKQITVDYPIIHLSSWMKSILETRPEFLLGGHCPFENEGAPYMDMFSCFWDDFQLHQPNHAIYEAKSAEERKFCIPFMLHGDEGRGLAKIPLLVLSYQVLIPFSGPNKLNCSKYLGYVCQFWGCGGPTSY